VCKLFREILPESKAVELRVLRGRRVDEEYMKRLSGKNQRVWLTVNHYNKEFESCKMRSMLSVFEDTIANVVSFDFTNLLFDICTCNFTDKVIENSRNRIMLYIIGLVKNAPNLERLILKNNALTDQWGALIFAALAEHTTLTELDLSRNRLREITFLAATGPISRNTSLKRISVADNMVGKLAIECFSVSIESCSNLTDLDVGGCGKLVTTFFPSLIANEQIRNFSAGSLTQELRWNALRTAMILSECSCQLVSLNLAFGVLGTDGCKYLARLFQRLTALRDLNLRGAEISEPGYRLLASEDAGEAQADQVAECGGGRMGVEFAVRLLGGEDPFADVLPDCLTRLADLPLRPRPAGRPALAGLAGLRSLNLSDNPGTPSRQAHLPSNL
jgi:hypothetical protein